MPAVGGQRQNRLISGPHQLALLVSGISKKWPCLPRWAHDQVKHYVRKRRHALGEERHFALGIDEADEILVNVIPNEIKSGED